MTKHIYLCLKCKEFTMKRECCGEKTIDPKPGKFSIADKYSKYRLKSKGVL